MTGFSFLKGVTLLSIFLFKIDDDLALLTNV